MFDNYYNNCCNKFDEIVQPFNPASYLQISLLTYSYQHSTSVLLKVLLVKTMGNSLHRSQSKTHCCFAECDILF